MRKLLLAATILALPAGLRAQAMPGMDMQHDHHQPVSPAAIEQESAPEPQPVEQPATHHHLALEAEDMDRTSHGSTGALGGYPMTREASGTAWQPDASAHAGMHFASGPWSFMAHGVLDGVYDWQEGSRGGEKALVSGMLMGSVRRSFGDDVLQFRAGFSPDPIMGRHGYPLLLASGETANGVAPLVDRQHPHDFFMELSASYSHRLSDDVSVFVYGGLPGEPAFGPPAFMHRLSIMDSPEAPISHHWLDSTHIVFGVLTGGLVYRNMKLEASRFRGREPDQHRWNIETGPLDSTAVRLSWNPSKLVALQGSWARVKSPEQLEPEENQTRWSASLIYTRPFGSRGWWSSTVAWGRRTTAGHNLDAFVLESAIGWGRWTLFGRAEKTENDELVSAVGHHGPAYEVGKVSMGVVRDFPLAPHVDFGIGAQAALNFTPSNLDTLYGGDPAGLMGFVRLKLH